MQKTPEEQSVRPLDEVEIVDPTHRLYGLVLPLARVIAHARLGPLCVVILYPGIDCFVPFPRGGDEPRGDEAVAGVPPVGAGAPALA